MDVLKISDCMIDLNTGEMKCGDQSQILSDKSLQLILCLAKATSQTVSRNELLNEIWQDRVVTDDSLTNLVSITRAQLKLIGQNDLIKTLPKKGYRLVGNVEFVSHSSQKQPKQASLSLTTQTLRLITKRHLVISFLLTCIVAALLIVNSDKDKLTVAILPVTLIDSEFSYGESLMQELHFSATQQKNLSVLSHSQAVKTWGEKADLNILNTELDTDYAVETQLRSQGEHQRVTMQWVSTKNREALLTGAYDVYTPLLKSDSAVIWQNISQLFIQQSLFELGVFDTSKANTAINLCNLYYQHFLLYKDGFLKNIELIAPSGLKICATSIELAPQNLQARVNQIELFDALIRSDLPNAAMQSVYLELFEQAIENLKQLPNSEVVVMESRLLFLIAQVANYAKEIDLDKVYSESESIIQALENKSITAKFANRAGVIRQRHINHLLRQGKNASELAKLAHAIVDKGLALEPNNNHLLYTKGGIYFRQAWMQVAAGENPTLAYNSAIAFFKSSLMQGDARAVNYDSIASSYSNLARWQIEQGVPFADNAQKAKEAYALAFARSETNFRSRNNAADMYAALMWAYGNSEATFQDYFSEGVKAAKAALVIKPDYPYPNFVLSQLYWAQAKLDFAANTGSVVAALECAQYFKTGANLMSKKASLYAALAYCQIVETQINIQQQRLNDALTSINALQRTVSKIEEMGQKSFQFLFVSGEAALLQAALSKLNQQPQQANSYLLEAIGNFSQAMNQIDSNREVLMGVMKALIMKEQLGAEVGSTEFSDSRYTMSHLLPHFDNNFPNDGRTPLLTQLSQSDKFEKNLVQRSNESFVQFIRRASLYYSLEPFIRD